MKYYVLLMDDHTPEKELLDRIHNEYNANLIDIRTLQEAIDELRRKKYYLIILIADYIKGDLIPALQLLRSLSFLPILILTTNYKANEQKESVKFGADLYMEYPETMDECIMTALALVRRFTEFRSEEERPSTTIFYHDLFLYVEYRRVFIRNKEILLSKNEFDLLHLLLSKPGRVFTFDEIYDRICGDTCEIYSVEFAVHNQIKRLRGRLKSHGHGYIDKCIKAVRGIGFRADNDYIKA